jgi:hypothetical protein
MRVCDNGVNQDLAAVGFGFSFFRIEPRLYLARCGNHTKLSDSSKASRVLGLQCAGPEDKLFLIRCRNSIDNVTACAHCDYGPGILQFT